MLVDTLGLLLTVVVHGAQVQDRDGARLVLAKARAVWTRLLLIWADGGYTGSLVTWTLSACGWFLEIVKRSDGAKGFELLPHRWIVERTLGWLGRYRRLQRRLRVSHRGQRNGDLRSDGSRDDPPFGPRVTFCNTL